MFYPTIATGTPLIGVIDNRGLSVRALNWNREQSADPLRLLVSHSYVDDASRVASHRDPRQFAAWSADDTAPSNLRTTPSLTGQVLRRESSDSGERVTLSDAAGRAVWMRDGRGTVQTVTYDELGRPSSGSEQLSGSSEIRVSWRSEYGDAGAADDGSQGNNLRGVNVRQYDSGGLLQVEAVALSGAVLSQGQRFLASAEVLPDWPEEESGRAALLEAEIYTTTVTADARGAVLNQTDAAGHVQAWRYDVSGAACHQTVTPAGEVDGLNLYRMVRNNPVTLKDADGRQPTAASSSDDKSPKYMFSPFISATDSLLYELLHKFYYSNILKKEEEVIKPIFVNKDQERSFNTQMDKEKDLMIIMLENILPEEHQELKHTQAVDIFNKFKEAYSQEGVFKFPPESSGGTLYISGHGAAGSDSIYPGTSKGSIREKSSYEIVDRLITKGLPEHFNIKTDFCWSGASLEPEDITVEEYQQAFLEGNIFNLVSGEDNSFLDQFADDLKEEIPEFKGTLSGYAGVVHAVKKVDINSHSRDGKPHYMVSLPVSGGSEFFMRKSDARRTITM